MNRTMFMIACFAAVIALSHAYNQQDFHAFPHYTFDYSVKDPHTGDVKGQWEKRIGDKVLGQYQVNDPDGTLRIVKYSADKHGGFNALVQRIGHAVHPIPYKLGKPSWGRS